MTQHIFAIGLLQDISCSRRVIVLSNDLAPMQAIGGENKSVNSFQKNGSNLSTERKVLKTQISAGEFPRY